MTSLGADVDFDLLVEDTCSAIRGGGKIALLGATSWTDRLVSHLRSSGLINNVVGVFSGAALDLYGVPNLPLEALAKSGYSHVVVCANREKEALINQALPHFGSIPIIIVSGYAHLEFNDEAFHEIQGSLLVPSLANGYPNTLVHIYQCLVNAHRLRLKGAVVEFGMFKGGTTMFMAKTIQTLGAPWQVIGFDTFDGFPPRRSPLDMYNHKGCVFRDYEAVSRIFAGMNVRLVKGDIVETCKEIENTAIVLAFVDTDNFTPASAVIEACRDRMVVGGAIVFDHFTGVDRFRYTLGERFAAKELLSDPRYLNLHGTGVFIRQQGSNI